VAEQYAPKISANIKRTHAPKIVPPGGVVDAPDQVLAPAYVGPLEEISKLCLAAAQAGEITPGALLPSKHETKSAKKAGKQ
jgi:hypothetical protein